MTRTTKNLIFVGLGLMIIAIVISLFVNSFGQRQEITTSLQQEERAVAAVVTDFGAHLKNVPLTSSTETAAKAIRDEYGPFVLPALIDRWAKDPSKAPGRLTSSPWPDRIEILNIQKEGNKYKVIGNVILMTSAEYTNEGNAGVESVLLTLISINDTWRISAYESERYSDSEMTQDYSNISPPFSFTYNNSFIFTRGALSNQERGFWSAFEQNLKAGTVYASLYLPKSYMEGTNFSEAWLSVGSSKDASAVARCITPPQFVTNSEKRGVKNYTYTTFHMKDAAAGNIYETTDYRILRDNTCWALEYTIHSTNIGNYEPGAVSEFNKTEVVNLLKDVVESFKFE